MNVTQIPYNLLVGSVTPTTLRSLFFFGKQGMEQYTPSKKLLNQMDGAQNEYINKRYSIFQIYFCPCII